MRRFLKFSSLPFIFSAIAILLLVFSCAPYGFFWGQFGADDVDTRSPSVRALRDINSSYLPDLASQTPPISSIYSILIITDVHFGAERENLDETAFLDWLDSWFQKYSAGDSKDETKLPRFVINLGDTADGGLREQFADYVQFEKKIKKIGGAYLYSETDETADSERKFKVYSILGNHDLYHNGAPHFEELLFPYISSYFFTIDTAPSDSYDGFSFYFLDTANGTMGTKQLDDFKEKLSHDSTPKIILTHYPVYAGGSDMFMIIQNSIERNTILTYFAKGNVKQVYEGHAHKNYGFDFKTFREEVIGSLRFSARDKKQCAIITVDEKNQSASTEVITF